MGRSTCASDSAFSLDAQPAQFERLVRRTCFPLRALAGLLINDSFTGFQAGHWFVRPVLIYKFEPQVDNNELDKAPDLRYYTFPIP